MEPNENMVPQDEEFEAEDSLSEELIEEPEEEAISLEEAIAEDEQSQEAKQPQSAGGQQKEPGYVQSRINKAVEKALAQADAKWAAKLEAELKPFRENQINMEAQELVRNGKVKDLETAKELVRYRMGQPQTAQAAENAQPRNERGQFAPKTQETSPRENPVTQAKVNMLAHQADTIKSKMGVDVIPEFQNNPEVKEKVISGEWDFYDVAEYLKGQKGGRKTPAPMRSPNGASGTSQAVDFSTMSKEQFARFEKKIEEGARFVMK